MINYPALYSALKKVGHPPVTWLQKNYQPVSMGGGGMEKHNDWVVGKWVPRIKTAYPVCLPFLPVAGNVEPTLQPIFNPDYPIAPGFKTEMHDYWDGEKTIQLPHILTMTATHDKPGQWSRQKAYFQGTGWLECFYSSVTKVPFMKQKMLFYYGFKLDIGDLSGGPMGWMFEQSISFKDL
jgi:hypothetical protein